ncbi:MAG: GNAT family N-acetyltransferase [Deltaproteobacteria bacterium]|nr:GNAT family N-acetyltransferase [Deltaproteobacteria bacterium]
MDITIREAVPRQATELSDIALKAKGYWGYASEQLDLWREEFLTVSPEYIKVNRVWVASGNTQQLVGFAAIEQRGAEAILEHLWVLPEYIGRGIGKSLFLQVAATIPQFVFTSDPHADDFYRKMGAQKIGDYYSVLQGKMLTKFSYTATLGGCPQVSV